MRRILFVDDEPRVLDGLESLLRRQRRDWKMVFVTSGEAALGQLAAGPFDVLVSDMRMPRMDGAELFRLVQERHPRTVRIVLAGETEQEAARRLVHTAHQFLVKPCNGRVLREVIERSCNLTSMLLDEGLKSTIGRLGQLPALPQIVTELNRVLADPRSSLKAVAAVVARDAALCAKVLQLVNSSFFGLARRVTSVDSAVSYLGTDVLKSLALMIEVLEFAGEDDSPVSGVSLHDVQAHSFLTARIAQEIAAEASGGQDSFVAGVLHDVGILVLAACMPEKLTLILAEARCSGRSVLAVEQQLIGVTHAEIGAYLLGLWGLPLSVVEAVAFHQAPVRVSQRVFDLLGIVHVADGLAREVRPGVLESQGIPHPSIDHGYLSGLGVADRLPRWRETAARMVQTTGVH